MFGLRNQQNSCWCNATLQAIFRIPEVQQRYSAHSAADANRVDSALEELWTTNGEEGMRAFFDAVRSDLLPAGHGTGDSHELFVFLCDKLPFLDQLCRFSVANVVKCAHCAYRREVRTDMIEFSIAPTARELTLPQAILDAVQPVDLPDWRCEEPTCKKLGGQKQLLLSAKFPQILVIHRTSTESAALTYKPDLKLNGIQYGLFAVVCYNGAHWWTYARNPAPGSDWYELNDAHVRNYGRQFYPLAEEIRLLMYYRLNV